MDERPTPLGAIVRGLAAGVAGTAAMTAWQTVSSKLQEAAEGSGGSSGESPDGGETDPWEEASAPAKVFKRFSEGVLGREVPAERIGIVTEAMHWGYGTSWGAVYGVLAGTLGRSSLRGGLAFGTAVWASSYAQLVPLGLYEPPWKYPPRTVALDLSYHLVYGAGVATAYRVLD